MSTDTTTSNTASIPAQMRAVRAEMNDDVEALVNSTEDLADWRKYVRAQPWLCIGAAALAGFLLAPTRKRQPPVAQTATKASVAGGMGGAILGALATSIANRAAMQLGQYVVDRFNPQSQPASQADESFRHD